MKIRNFAALIIVFVFFSCVGQKHPVFIPAPDFGIYNVSEQFIEINKIIQTRDGSGIKGIPNWLLAYIDGGIEAVEKLDAYNGKYVFIAENRGENIIVLNKWIENYSEKLDFPMLAAARMEKRMILSASLYPDNEYGRFYEAMIKNAYGGEYPSAVKEDTYWIKIWFERENTLEYTESYRYFVLITINKMALQMIIRNMIMNAGDAVSVTAAQKNAIDRLRQNFFEGF